MNAISCDRYNSLPQRDSAPQEGNVHTSRRVARGFLVRRLVDDDRGMVLDHFLRLPEPDREMRFCRVFPDESVLRYVDNIDLANDVCFGILNDGAEIIALVQSFAYMHCGVRMLEVAFSTDPLWRCQGLATTLFLQVTDHAAKQRIDRVIAQCLASNRPMRALLRAVGAVCEVDDREVTGEFKLGGAFRPIVLGGPRQNVTWR